MKPAHTESVIRYLLTNKKYRVLIHSLVALFFGILAVVWTNFYIAHISTHSTKHMDIIGNISDLTLEIATGAQHLALVDASDKHTNEQIIHTLQQQARQLDDYMLKLEQYDKKEQAMDEFAEIWHQYRQKIAMLSNNKPEERLALASYAYQQQARIWDLMNIGYDTYLNDTYKMADYARYLQFISVLGLLCYFIFFINYTIRQMQQADLTIDKAQSEMTDIMSTAKEGLFLIDKNLIIGENYSKELERLLGRKKLAGLTLPQLLENLVSKHQIKETQEYIQYLSDSKTAEDLIQHANPLKQVELKLIDENGMTSTRFLHFDFLRVINPENKKLIKIFVSVFDITEVTNLKNQIQKDKVAFYDYINNAGYLLSLDQHLVKNFVAQNRNNLAKIEETLNAPVLNQNMLIDKIKKMIFHTDNLKNQAQILEISQFIEIAINMAFELKRLTRLSHLQSQDLSLFTNDLVHYKDMLDLTEHLITQQTYQLTEYTKTDQLS